MGFRNWLGLWGMAALAGCLGYCWPHGGDPRAAMAGVMTAINLALGAFGVWPAYTSNKRGCLSLLLVGGAAALGPFGVELVSHLGLATRFEAHPIYMLAVLAGLLLAAERATLAELTLNLGLYLSLCTLVVGLDSQRPLHWLVLAALGGSLLIPSLIHGAYRGRRGQEASDLDYRRLERVLGVCLGVFMLLGTMAAGIEKAGTAQQDWGITIGAELVVLAIGVPLLWQFARSKL